MSKSKLISYGANLLLILLLYGIITALLSAGILNNYYKGIIFMICINIMLACSLNLSTGFLGQLVLGHAAFMYTGAYSAAILSMQLGINNTWGLLISLIFGGLVAAVFGIVIGIPALRLRGDYLAIITLGFGQIIQSIILNMKITGGPKGLMGIPAITNFTIVFFAMVFTIVVLSNLIRSRHGRAMLSIREDEIAAESSGISTTYYKLLGFTIAAFFAGVAGGLYAHYLTILLPKNIGFNYSIELLVIVVLGGMGSFTGSIISAILLTILPELLRGFSNYRMLIYSIVLILMMIYRPTGLMGNYEFSLQHIWKRLFGKGVR